MTRENLLNQRSVNISLRKTRQISVMNKLFNFKKLCNLLRKTDFSRIGVSIPMSLFFSRKNVYFFSFVQK